MHARLRQVNEPVTEHNLEKSILASDEASNRPKGFVMPTAPPKREPPKTPKAKDIRTDYPYALKPGTDVVEKLFKPRKIIVVDVETNDWVERKGAFSPYKGKLFGFWTGALPENLKSRIVSLAWVITDLDPDSTPHLAKEALVKPGSVKPEDGYEITEKATRRHKISHAQATAEGRPLPDVLREFMRDVAEAYESGGRIVAHHIEFDAAVIKHELDRCGFDDLCKRWGAMVEQGVCTMDPFICKWVQYSYGKQMKKNDSHMALTGLVEMFGIFAPHRQDLIKKHHQALADAEMCRLLYLYYLDLAQKAGCIIEED